MDKDEISKAIKENKDISFIIDSDIVIAKYKGETITLDTPARTLKHLLGELGIEVNII